MSADSESWPPPNDPIAFESLCLELWKDIWSDPNAQKNGRSGQSQAGIDVYGVCQGKWKGIQCKQKDGLLRRAVSTADLELEANAAKLFIPELDGFILATTGPRDGKLQQRARELTELNRKRGLFTVSVWSWPDIWAELYKRKPLLRRIATIYWPILSHIKKHGESGKASSRLFLGRSRGSEFLFGRTDELIRLDESWAGANKKNIVSIFAFGGMGKTSLVAHWAADKLTLSQGDYVDGYFDWCFHTDGSFDNFLTKALESFGDPAFAVSSSGAWKKGERLAQLLGRRRSLIILDGFEILQDFESGELQDEGARSLLRGLAASNVGLCLITSRLKIPDLAIWRERTVAEWKLECLDNAAGSDLLSRLGVDGSDLQKRELSRKVKGHALTLTLLGCYLKRVHHGDIRRVDRIDFREIGEKEEGGHAFRVIRAYDDWFKEGNWHVERLILLILGLFDRPATPDCLAALLARPIKGFTDEVSSLTENDWNNAVSHLVELRLIEMQPWKLRHTIGYSDDIGLTQLLLAQRSCARGIKSLFFSIIVAINRLGRKSVKLGEPQLFEFYPETRGMIHSLDTHLLIREYFGRRLEEISVGVSNAAHGRLFDHLQDCAPYWPEGLDNLQILYQAVRHGCLAGRSLAACLMVYRDRINRGALGPHAFYSTTKVGAVGTDLNALRNFFVDPWVRPLPEFSEDVKCWLFNQAAYRLHALGRLNEAQQAIRHSRISFIGRGKWRDGGTCVYNQSQMEKTQGNISIAIAEAQYYVDLVVRDNDAFATVTSRSFLAYMFYLGGRFPEAQSSFERAESLLVKVQPNFPLLYAEMCFWYCCHLLRDSERGAWASILGIPITKGHRSLIKICNVVAQRVVTTQEWAKHSEGVSTLARALNQLISGRAIVYRCLLGQAGKPTRHSSLTPAISYLDSALSGLERSGLLYENPEGLLSRALLRGAQGELSLAEEDLNVAWLIAESGPMRLHMVDVHLHRARLFYRESAYPWKSPQDDLDAAERLIEECGYYRRRDEFEDARKVMV